MIRTDKRTFVGPSPSRGLRCLPDDRLRPQLRFNATPKRRLLSDTTNTGELGDKLPRLRPRRGYCSTKGTCLVVM